MCKLSNNKEKPNLRKKMFLIIYKTPFINHECDDFLAFYNVLILCKYVFMRYMFACFGTSYKTYVCFLVCACLAIFSKFLSLIFIHIAACG